MQCVGVLVLFWIQCFCLWLVCRFDNERSHLIPMSLFLFFFFKQKTAYEMRISDWSSDVCSSDLPLQASIRFFRDPLPTEVSEALARFLVWVCEAGTPKIGRASCRERVCQYV